MELKIIINNKLSIVYISGFLRLSRHIIIVIVITFLILEIVGRILDPLGISYYPEMAKYLDTMLIEEPLGYRNRPNLKGNFFGKSVSINSLGMRDREISVNPDNEFRILVMGDSVPYGIGVQFEESFPYQLETILNSDSNNRHFRTLNMGVPSYNTEQELLLLKTLGISLQPQLAILLFSSNDIEPKMWVFDKRRSWYANLIQRSYAASLLYILYRELKKVLADKGLLLAQRLISPANAGQISFHEYNLASDRWKAIDQSLTAMNALLRQRGIPFVLFTNQELPHILTLLHSVADREKFPVINLTPWLSPRWRFEEPRKYTNSYVDGHPNPAGHFILATLIAENLRELDVLGLP